MRHLTFTQLLELIDESNREACKKLYAENKERFDDAPGSLTKHQAWPGGYIGHLTDAMNFGCNLYELMNSERPLDFTVADVVLVLFLHDLEKPYRYIEPKITFETDHEKHSFIDGLVEKYGIKLGPNHVNALKYIHGEGEDYSRTVRVQEPLAAFVHMCDVASARIWFDYPKQ